MKKRMRKGCFTSQGLGTFNPNFASKSHASNSRTITWMYFFGMLDDMDI